MLLVTIMLGSILLAMAPAAASRAKAYNVQRDPLDVASGDLDCDGDNDLVTASDMGMFISILYNENGDFSDRQDVWISNNQTRRAGFFDIADASAVEIGDIDGDNNPDIIFFQANIRVVGGNTVMGNLTVLYGNCEGDWTPSTSITVSPYMIDIRVEDMDGDGNDDIIGLFIDSTIINMALNIYHGPDPTLIQNQATTTMPLGGATGHYYYGLEIGEWGEASQIAPPPSTGSCDDLDAWMLTAPAYNGPQAGFDAGNWDNITALEYDCTTRRFYDPATNPGNTHVFAMASAETGGFDIADTDGDGEIDMVAMVEGWEQNITYAERSGTTWTVGSKAPIGDFVGASVAIEDVNQDGDVDFVVPTMLSVTTVTSTGRGNTTLLSTDNLADLNTVNIILSDGSGGWTSPQTFNVGRRPTMVIVDQLSGGAGSALDLAVGQRDYTFTYGDGTLWVDSKGWPGALDTINIIQLDAQDVGISGLSVSPATWNPETRRATLGEGTRDVNVTVKNTGLETISGSVDVELSVREVIGGTDTVVYSNDFDGNVVATNCTSCMLGGASYSGEFADSPDGTSWHIEKNNASSSPEAWEADNNPTGYYWAGVHHTNSTNAQSETGYYNNQDEALILSNVDLSGTDAAFLDVDLMCTVGYSVIYYSSNGIANRIVYDDSCSVDIWSEVNGWTTIDYFGGYDNDRYVHLNNGLQPERTVNNNLYYRGTLYNWLNLTGENAYDLTPWAGETIDIRFHFRSGFDGTVGTDDETNQTQFDGFAIDNLSIRKTSTTYAAGSTPTTTPLTLTNLVPGGEEIVTMQVNFVNNKTYMIESELISTSGFTNADTTNDDIRFRTTVENLFDPAVDEITSFEKGQLYASDTYPIDVKVSNQGNTVTDFSVRATVSSATPNLLLREDFEPRSTAPFYGDDGDAFGTVIDDTASTVQNSIVPGNRPLFGSAAYWFGGPDDGYGDSWNESMTLAAIDLTQMTSDFAYLSFDYFAETNVLWQGDDIVGVTEYAALEVQWRNGSDIYTGRVYGNWNDYNENGVRPNQTCEDIDDNGDFDEVEYIGDHTDKGDYIVWFDSRGLVDSVTLDMTHVVIQNTTGPSSNWAVECTTFRGSEVTMTWRFLSDDDGVNGVDGLAGFAIDNISVQEYTFTPVQTYEEPANGLDSQEDMTVNVANHYFDSGIYRVDSMTIFDNQTMGDAWYGEEELFLSNNVSRVIFEVASVDLTLYVPDVLTCVDYSIACVYPIDTVKQHSFSVGFKNGVLAGEFDIKLTITDVTTGQQVASIDSDQSPYSLVEHQLGNATWSQPYAGWIDGHEYNLSFNAMKTADGSNAGNDHSFHIVFSENVDVAILSDNTDQQRLQSVRADLDAMGMTYTQFTMNDWDTYVTSDWLIHYDKVLLPWQTTTNVVNRQYYERLDTIRTSDGLSPRDVMMTFMLGGGTVEMHLGPYNTHYTNPSRLPFGISVANRNEQSTYITYNQIKDNMFQNPYHPLMENVNPVSFVGINSGNFVASAALATTQTDPTELPTVCGGTPTAPLGTFQNILQGIDSTMSLLATCAYGQGGLIVTTIDVENPSVSERHDSMTMPLLANLLKHQVTPYPADFGIPNDGWSLSINGETPDFDTLTGNYTTNNQCKCHYMKSSAELDFSFVTELTGLNADWELTSGDGNPVSTSIRDNVSASMWSNSTLAPGENTHVAEDSFTGRFCVSDAISSTNCRIDAHWILTIFVHDAAGHMRKTSIHLYTNDVKADEHSPQAMFTVKDHPSSRDNLQDLGEHPDYSGQNYWQVRLKRTGDIIVQFSAENSSDADATSGSGISGYKWDVYFDWPYDAANPDPTPKMRTENSADFSHLFKNITVDPEGFGTLDIRIDLTVTDLAGKESEPYMMFFKVVPESYGDEPPVVEITTPIDGSTQSGDNVWINGSVLSGSENGNVQVEVAFDATHLNLSPAQKFTKDEQGKYNSTNGLGNTDPFSMALDISDLYVEGEGVQQTIWIKITEGSGSDAYVIYKQIDINLIPADSTDPCVADPNAAGCSTGNSTNEDTAGVDTWVLAAGGGGVLLLLVIILATMVILRRGGNETTVTEGFAGVESLDPMEAYVQQLIAQGYDEPTARAYAQQYASHFQEQAVQQQHGDYQ
jgi:hypothetical protein